MLFANAIDWMDPNHENFADCYNGVTWKEYVEHRAERFDLEYCNDCQVVEGNSDWHTCPHH